MQQSFETALRELRTLVDQLAAEGIPREMVEDAALLIGLGKGAGVALGGDLRAILQLPAPAVNTERTALLQRLYHAFGVLIDNLARGFLTGHLADCFVSLRRWSTFSLFITGLIWLAANTWPLLQP